MKRSYMGCFSGDCPHEKQSECDESIEAHCAELETGNDALEAKLKIATEALELCIHRDVPWGLGDTVTFEEHINLTLAAIKGDE